MDYLIRFAQQHESFRRPELESLAAISKISLQIADYDPQSPYCIVRLKSDKAARKLISRSILADAVYELWGQGEDYTTLHASIRHRTKDNWHKYMGDSFRFSVHGYQGKRDTQTQTKIIESFQYLGFDGPILMKGSKHEFCVFEHFDRFNPVPTKLYFGRLIGKGDRHAVAKYDLKRRTYINTTSMDAELALLTANIAQAAPGKLYLDPFVGTAGFPIACAHFGAMAIGSDIDGRSIRGKTDRNVRANFTQYGLAQFWLDAFAADLTNSPVRRGRWLDGIICDPPYGIREGCKVLGSSSGTVTEKLDSDGVAMHLKPDFVAPKKQYSFEQLLDDILDFAAEMIVDNGRLGIWIPTEGSEGDIPIPQNPYLVISSVCVQAFNKWSRRLVTFTRLPEQETGVYVRRDRITVRGGKRADDLNPFRKLYFSSS